MQRKEEARGPRPLPAWQSPPDGAPLYDQCRYRALANTEARPRPRAHAPETPPMRHAPTHKHTHPSIHNIPAASGMPMAQNRQASPGAEDKRQRPHPSETPKRPKPLCHAPCRLLFDHHIGPTHIACTRRTRSSAFRRESEARMPPPMRLGVCCFPQQPLNRPLHT